MQAHINVAEKAIQHVWPDSYPFADAYGDGLSPTLNIELNENFIPEVLIDYGSGEKINDKLVANVAMAALVNIEASHISEELSRSGSLESVMQELCDRFVTEVYGGNAEVHLAFNIGVPFLPLNAQGSLDEFLGDSSCDELDEDEDVEDEFKEKLDSCEFSLTIFGFNDCREVSLIGRGLEVVAVEDIELAIAIGSLLHHASGQGSFITLPQYFGEWCKNELWRYEEYDEEEMSEGLIGLYESGEPLPFDFPLSFKLLTQDYPEWFISSGSRSLEWAIKKISTFQLDFSTSDYIKQIVVSAKELSSQENLVNLLSHDPSIFWEGRAPCSHFTIGWKSDATPTRFRDVVNAMLTEQPSNYDPGYSPIVDIIPVKNADDIENGFSTLKNKMSCMKYVGTLIDLLSKEVNERI